MRRAPAAGGLKRLIKEVVLLRLMLLLARGDKPRTQDAPQWIVAQRPLSALTIPGSS